MRLQNNNKSIDYISLRRELIKNGLIDITKLFSIDTVNLLSEEMNFLLEGHSRRNDFFSSHTEMTPRNMNTVGEKLIKKYGKHINNFYFSKETKYIISCVAGEIVSDLPWTGERYVVNALLKQNDTHGWHWDDYSYALVFIPESPQEQNGGLLECVPHTYWNKSNPNINKIVSEQVVGTYYFRPGSFYLMKSDTTLHRVTPILNGERRLSLAMSYCNESDLAKNIDHNTVTDLYDS